MSELQYKSLVLVEVGNSTPPLYVVIRTLYEPGEWDNIEYAIEEQTCPRDTLGVLSVLTDGDTDPHGILTVVEAVPIPDDWPFVGVVDWDRYRRLFSKLPESASAPASAITYGTLLGTPQ